MWSAVLVLTFAWGAFGQETNDGEASPAGEVVEANSVTELLQAAAVHTVHNRHAEAEKCYRQILRLEEEAGQKDSPTALTASYLLAIAVRRQGRWDEAHELYETTLRRQQVVLGPDHEDVQQTASSLASLSREMAWNTCMDAKANPEQRQRAIELAQRAAELAVPHGPWWLVGLAKHKAGDAEGSLAEMNRSLGADESWIGQFFIMALVCSENGERQAALDWFAAATDWMASINNKWKPNVQLYSQAAALLEVGKLWPPKDWSSQQYADSYSRLVEKYPELPGLWNRLGMFRGALEAWDQAIAAYERAAQLNPEGWRTAEALAATQIFVKEGDAHSAICRRLYEQFKDSASANAVLDVVLLCSLTPAANVDRTTLVDNAMETAQKMESRPFVELAKGMALYRAGRYEDALDVLPDATAKFTNIKDELLALLFRAMVHQQLGDKFAPRKMLQEARLQISDRLTSPDGDMLPAQARPVVWCMVHTVLREAEALIGPEGS